VHLSTSFGLAIHEPDDEALPTARDLLRAGETALYTARKNRTQVHVFDSSATPDSDRFQRREALRRALRRDELVPYYHPIVDVNTTAVTEVEALLRWDHPERGLVPPSEFIPLAEETGLIADLDRWVLEHAIEQVATWRASGDGPQRVSVNVTASRHSGTDFQGDVQQLLHEHNVPGEALTLETTERVAFRQTRPFETLRREGVHIAIDDFGTGYSALFYLRTFDADVLKIDRGFVSELGTGNQTEILVRAMLDIATHMDMTAIAEGVETEAQLDELRTLGCPSAQGYLFGPPMPAAALEQALAEGALCLSS
jgi:EAL domain-containing protein (putative c-di-GMP-specific phosphodiesterase class I)